MASRINIYGWKPFFLKMEKKILKHHKTYFKTWKRDITSYFICIFFNECIIKFDNYTYNKNESKKMRRFLKKIPGLSILVDSINAISVIVKYSFWDIEHEEERADPDDPKWENNPWSLLQRVP